MKTKNQTLPHVLLLDRLMPLIGQRVRICYRLNRLAATRNRAPGYMLAQRALADFDAAHPEVRDFLEVEAEEKARRQARD